MEATTTTPASAPADDLATKLGNALESRLADKIAATAESLRGLDSADRVAAIVAMLKADHAEMVAAGFKPKTARDAVKQKLAAEIKIAGDRFADEIK